MSARFVSVDTDTHLLPADVDAANLEPIRDALPGAGLLASCRDADGVLWIAHRGGGILHPEHTMEGYRAMVAQGCRAIEQDIVTLADGSLGVMHDLTVDRTTDGTGNVGTYDAASWRRLAVDTGTGAWTGTTDPPALFEDVVREFGNRVLLVPEVRGSDGTAVVQALLDGGVHPDAALVQAFGLSALSAAVEAGFRTCALGTGSSPSELVAAGVDSVAMIGTTPKSTFDDYAAVGLEIGAYDVNTRHDRDLLRSWGVTLFLTDDPAWLAPGAPAPVASLLPQRSWWPGCNHNWSLDPGAWTFDGGKLTINGLGPPPLYRSLFLGPISPINGDATSDAFVIDFELTWHSAETESYWVIVELSPDDRLPTNGANATRTGLRCLARKNGQVLLYDITTNTQIDGDTTSSIADEGTATYRITVTPETVTFDRLDVAGTASAPNTAPGAYVALTSQGAHVTVDSLVVT